MPSISDLDFSLLARLVAFLSYSPLYSQSIKRALYHTFNFLITAKSYYQHFLPALTRLVRKYRLTTEYSGCEYCFTGLAYPNIDPPYLINALSSDPSTVFSTYDSFTTEIELDVKDMIGLIPDALVTRGKLPYQFKFQISPLAVACCNMQVPAKLIDYMLQKGANPNECFVHTAMGLLISPLYYLELSLKSGVVDGTDEHHQRNVLVTNLLKKYGGESICNQHRASVMIGEKPLTVSDDPKADDLWSDDDFPDLIPSP